ncbi:hypothetical protein SMSP2_02824 [Limihaloglobus sulfuriphilus]|uniref:Uncharacterized protein n=1 Tax=Limihaloglobus sulfuriphilus TaxID=1851148 RepID=A0A1Q2MID5_9BACT|nr:hypothetical protein SMSP2_02824 [Limihaloglobus sulfuriphilus]
MKAWGLCAGGHLPRSPFTLSFTDSGYVRYWQRVNDKDMASADGGETAVRGRAGFIAERVTAKKCKFKILVEKLLITENY